MESNSDNKDKTNALDGASDNFITEKSSDDCSSAADIEMGGKQHDEDTKTSTLTRVESSLPKCLYCPILGTLLQDPMVGSNGISYEKCVVDHRRRNQDDTEKDNVENPRETADDTESSCSSSLSTLDKEGKETSHIFKNKFYSNRALFQILQERRFRQDAPSKLLRRLSSIGTGKTISGTWKQWHGTVSLNFQQQPPSAVEELQKPDDADQEPKDTADASNDSDEDIFDDEDRILSDEYYCPITFNLIQDPVIDPEGNTYERIAMEHWIQRHGSSPITRAPLSMDDLYTNRALLDMIHYDIDQYCKRMEATKQPIHSSIMEWKKYQVSPELFQSTVPKMEDIEAEAERRRQRLEAFRQQQRRQKLLFRLFAGTILLASYIYLLWVMYEYHLSVVFIVVTICALAYQNRKSSFAPSTARENVDDGSVHAI